MPTGVYKRSTEQRERLSKQIRRARAKQRRHLVELGKRKDNEWRVSDGQLLMALTPVAAPIDDYWRVKKPDVDEVLEQLSRGRLWLEHTAFVTPQRYSTKKKDASSRSTPGRRQGLCRFRRQKVKPLSERHRLALELRERNGLTFAAMGQHLTLDDRWPVGPARARKIYLDAVRARTRAEAA